MDLDAYTQQSTTPPAPWLAALDESLDLTEALPDAASAILLPASLTTLAPSPIYGRAPDAKPSVPK